MKNKSIYLTHEGYQLLREQCASGHLSAFNKHRLLQDLKDAHIVGSDNLPLNIVSTGTSVLLTNVEKQQTFSIRIAFMPDSASTGNVIPPTDSLAVALLGYGPGAIIPWEFEQGVHSLQVISVYGATHQ